MLGLSPSTDRGIPLSHDLRSLQGQISLEPEMEVGIRAGAVGK